MEPSIQVTSGTESSTAFWDTIADQLATLGGVKENQISVLQ